MEYSWVSEISTPSVDDKNGLSSISRAGRRGELGLSSNRRTRGEMRETAVKELWSALDSSLKDDDNASDQRQRDKGSGRAKEGRRSVIHREDRGKARSESKSGRRKRKEKMRRMLRDELGRLSLSREKQKEQLTGVGIFREKKARDVTAGMHRRGDLLSGRSGRLTPCESNPSVEGVFSHDAHNSESFSRQASDGMVSTGTWRSGVSGDHKQGRAEYPHWGDGSSKILDMTFQKLVENYGFRTIGAPGNDNKHAHGDSLRFKPYRTTDRSRRRSNRTRGDPDRAALEQARKKRTRKEIQDESLCTRSSSMSELSDMARQSLSSPDPGSVSSPTTRGGHSTPRRRTRMTTPRRVPRPVGNMPRLSSRIFRDKTIDSTTFDAGDVRRKGQTNTQSFYARTARRRHSHEREASASTDQISGDTFVIQKQQNDQSPSATVPHRPHHYSRNSCRRQRKPRYSQRAFSADSRVQHRMETTPVKWPVHPEWPKWSGHREHFRQMIDSIRKRSHRKGLSPGLSARNTALCDKEIKPPKTAKPVTPCKSTVQDITTQRTATRSSRLQDKDRNVTDSYTLRNRRLGPVSFDRSGSFSELQKEGFSLRKRKDRAFNDNAKSTGTRHRPSGCSSKVLLPAMDSQRLDSQFSTAYEDLNFNYDGGEHTCSAKPNKNNNDISGVRPLRKYLLPSSREDPGDNKKWTASYFIGEYLFELWNNQCLCDVRLEVGDHSFLAHKVVLAAFSDLFYPPNPHDVPTASFQLPCVNPQAVHKVLLYLYTSEMELTDDMLEYVLVAADSLGILDVVDMVQDILMKPTLDTMDLYMDIRARHNMSTSLADSPETYRLYFLELIDTDYFLRLGISEVETILIDPNTIVNSEVDAFHAVAKWILHCAPQRILHAGRLLQHVNFECIAPEDLAKLVDEYNFLLDNNEANDLLMEIFRGHAVNHDLLLQQNSSAFQSPPLPHSAQSNHWTPQASTEPSPRLESSYGSVSSSCAACQPGVTTSPWAQRCDTANHQAPGNLRSRLGKWLRLGSRKTDSPRDCIQGRRQSADYHPSHLTSIDCTAPQDVWNTPTSPYNLWNNSPHYPRDSQGRRRNFHDDTTISTPSKGSCPSTDTSPYTHDHSDYVSSYPGYPRTRGDHRNNSRSSSAEPTSGRYGSCSHHRYHHILGHNHGPQHHNDADLNHSFHHHPPQYNIRHRGDSSAYEESDQRSSGCLSDSEHIYQNSFSSSSSRAPSKGKRVSFGPCQTGKR